LRNTVSGAPRGSGTIYLDELTWDGAPDTVFRKPEGGKIWRRAWVDGVDQYDRWYPETYRLVQNEGVGLVMQGTREWTDYSVSAAVTPHMVKSCGIAARCQGMRRYVALTLGHDAHGRKALLLFERRGDEGSGGSVPFDWQLGTSYRLRLEVRGQSVKAWADDQASLGLDDLPASLSGGGIALVCEEGRAAFEDVTVRPVG
jgi:hypothetical protein